MTPSAAFYSVILVASVALALVAIDSRNDGLTVLGVVMAVGAVQRIGTVNRGARQLPVERIAVSFVGAALSWYLAKDFDRPQTNGKVERFNRTLLQEWAYAEPFETNTDRRDALDTWLHLYNHHRAHTAIGGHPPITRVHNPAGQNI